VLYGKQGNDMANKVDQAIMKQCVADLKELLESNWDEIASMKDEQEGRIKVSAAFLISFRGNEQAVKTTLTYGRRISDARESIINPDQLEMFEGEPADDEGPEMLVNKPTRRKAAHAID
jgi:hypothetical protein